MNHEIVYEILFPFLIYAILSTTNFSVFFENITYNKKEDPDSLCENRYTQVNKVNRNYIYSAIYPYRLANGNM